MYLYPKWLRLWHLINAILVVILIYSGLSMQYTGKEDPLLLMKFANAVRWHNSAAVILIISYAGFVAGNLYTQNGRFYRMERKNFWSDIRRQMKYYSLGMFRGEKNPFPVTLDSKFNPLQKLTYVLIMYFALPLIIISGLGLMFPEITIGRIFGVSGLVLTDLLHIIMGFLVTVFLVIHIYTCTLGSKPTSLFRGMISGYHESDDQ